jgi:hypothetical protein
VEINMSDYGAISTQPHPAVAQLAALHHLRIHVDIGIVVVALAITNVVAHFSSAWAGVVMVPAAAVVLLVLVRARGLGWAELGLGREQWKSGVRYAAAAIALVLAVVAIGALLPWTLDLSALLWALLPPWCCLAPCRFPRQSLAPPPTSFRGAVGPRRRPRQLRLVPWCGCCPPPG